MDRKPKLNKARKLSLSPVQLAKVVAGAGASISPNGLAARTPVRPTFLLRH